MVSETITLNEVLDISKKLSVSDQLQLIGRLSERLRAEIHRSGEPVDMLSLAGLGAELWRAVDVADYLEQERASWEG